MTVVRPFRAVRYDLSRVELSKVIVPPYDVIAADERGSFFDRDPHNAIRFELTRDAADEAETDYGWIRETLDAWRASGVLVQDDAPAFYVMGQRYEAPRKLHSRKINVRYEIGTRVHFAFVKKSTCF